MGKKNSLPFWMNQTIWNNLTMFFKNQTTSGGFAVPPRPPLWKIPPKVRGIINETVPKCANLQHNLSLPMEYYLVNFEFIVEKVWFGYTVWTNRQNKWFLVYFG